MMQPLVYIMLALIPAFMLLDVFYQARRYSPFRFWRVRATLITIAVILIIDNADLFWFWLLGEFSLFNLSQTPFIYSVTIALFTYELLHYAYHRLAHRWYWLWRAGHQMHHSAESLDAFGAFYLHPVDAFVFSSWTTLVFYPLLGMSSDAAISCTLFLTFNAMFQHANIRTPRWLGYIIQRPESHQYHHGRDIKRCNYANLPVIDLIFGTFYNPDNTATDSIECGLFQGASTRLLDMLFFRDIKRDTLDMKKKSSAKPVKQAA